MAASTTVDLIFKAAFGELTQAKGVLGELKDKTEQAQKEADKLSSSMSTAGKAGLAFGVAVGTVLTTMIGMTKAAIDQADEFNKMSQKVGISTEALSGWAYAAQLSDVSQEQMKKGLTSLSVKMDEVAGKNDNTIAAFKRLGVSVLDAKGNVKDTEEVFLDMADKFSELEDGASKTALASEFFGKKIGPDLLPLLNQGRKGIEDLSAEALKFGLIIKKDVAAQAEEFNDTLTRMKGVAGGMGTQLAAGLLPTLEKFSKIMLDNVNDGTKMETMVATLDAGIKLLASSGLVVMRVFDGLGTALGGAAAMIGAALNRDWEGVKTIYNEMEKDNQKAAADFKKTWDNIWSDAAAGGEVAKKKKNKVAPPDTTDVKKATDDLKAMFEEIRNLADPLLKWNEKIEAADKLLKAKRITLEEYTTAVQYYEKEIVKIIFAETADEKAKREKNEEIKKLRDKYLEVINPMKKYWDQLIEIEEAERRGALTKEESAAASAKVSTNMFKAGEAGKEAANSQTELLKDLAMAAEGYGKSMTDAFVNWAITGKASVKDMVTSVIADLAKMLMYQSIVKPLLKAGTMALFGFKDGGVFSDGAPQPFADGLVSSPTEFAMSNGAKGLAGESGTEAIMPLKRDAAGRLGVSGGGGGGISVGQIVVNVGSGANSEDAPAISAAATEGIQRAFRQLVQDEIHTQMRMGNSLNPYGLRGFT